MQGTPILGRAWTPPLGRGRHWPFTKTAKFDRSRSNCTPQNCLSKSLRSIGYPWLSGLSRSLS